ncbi:protein kinase [Frigoribacterium sp. CFBP 8766]|uniref:serine/threonine-protein kinase n=1 Tax=Frigoribacterium sp. CFBP 8766 TaxID=2775273 RepID=UPI0017804A53|nr:serine/threonine-protein kinase [Frigoribacterium sp. CFBP 8766]MBD8586095.1 protein kinase [Frigoribacterium sp. CFBP 8766]
MDDRDDDATADDRDAPRLLAGRYLLGDVLGRGGMSTVHRADDQLLGRTIAVKLLSAQGSDPADAQRAQNEVAVLASLSHHALVTLYDADVAPTSGPGWLAMELVDGPSLSSRLAEGPLDTTDAAQLLVDLAGALHVVQTAGIVHRDVKPSNVLLAPSPVPGRRWSPKLADFGIASLVDSTRVTATGAVLGTAAYLSPEQALGTRVGPASDVYSLGLVVLEALTGERAFPGSMMESLTGRLHRDPVVPDALGPEWASLLRAMTAREAEARPTALEVHARADALVAGGSRADDARTGAATALMPSADGDAATRRLPAGAAAGLGAAGLGAGAAGALAGSGAADAATERFGAVDGGTGRPAGSGAGAAAGAGTGTSPDGSAAAPERRSRRGAVIAGLVALALGAAALIGFAVTQGDDEPVAPATSDSPAPSETTPAETETEPADTPSPSTEDEEPAPEPSTAEPTDETSSEAPAPEPSTPVEEPAPSQPSQPTAPGNSGNNGNGNGNGNGNSGPGANNGTGNGAGVGTGNGKGLGGTAVDLGGVGGPAAP